jgi:hypothetical protein
MSLGLPDLIIWGLIIDHDFCACGHLHPIIGCERVVIQKHRVDCVLITNPSKMRVALVCVIFKLI